MAYRVPVHSSTRVFDGFQWRSQSTRGGTSGPCPRCPALRQRSRISGTGRECRSIRLPRWWPPCRRLCIEWAVRERRPESFAGLRIYPAGSDVGQSISVDRAFRAAVPRRVLQSVKSSELRESRHDEHKRRHLSPIRARTVAGKFQHNGPRSIFQQRRTEKYPILITSAVLNFSHRRF